MNRNLNIQKSPFVISDTIDEMVIVINVNSGAYYSLTTIGGQLWSKIGTAHVDFSEQEFNSIKTMADEGLLAVDGEIATTQVVEFFELGTKYMDMEGMLMGDPIHEVDEQGWPAMKDKG
jgi:hypothetical protein